MKVPIGQDCAISVDDLLSAPCFILTFHVCNPQTRQALVLPRERTVPASRLSIVEQLAKSDVVPKRFSRTDFLAA